jgi:flagellar biosynthesis/type III secretory pathway protein FliH
MSQYRFQQQYLERERQQQVRFQTERNHDYDRDPYYYTAPIYRYSRGGNSYETNEYGAGYLREAINTGYQEGYRTGEADRQDRWHSDYRDSFAYRDANYGYNSYYLDQADYNYYFREGFQRGYEDGFTSRYQYGQYEGGRYRIQESFSIQILGFQSLR